MSGKVYAGDTGTRITLDCGTDISAASERSIEVLRPDGATTSWPATASGTTAIYFDTVAGSLNQAGTWKLQAKVKVGSGTWLGQVVTLQVNAPFQ